MTRAVPALIDAATLYLSNWLLAPFECSKQNIVLNTPYLNSERGPAFGSSRDKTVVIKSPADRAQQYIGFARSCLKVARSLTDREDRIVHREMAAEWIRLAQMMAEDAAYDAGTQVSKARIGTVS